MKLVGEFSGIKIYTLGDKEMVLSKDTAGVFAGIMRQLFPMTKAAAEKVEAGRTDSQQLQTVIRALISDYDKCDNFDERGEVLTNFIDTLRELTVMQ
jgi:hypothetical protein